MRILIASLLITFAAAAGAADKAEFLNAERSHIAKWNEEWDAQQKAKEDSAKKGTPWLQEEIGGLKRWQWLLLGAIASLPTVLVVRRQ